MRIYWYWPWPHRTDNPLALATARAGDRLTVHSLATFRGRPIGHATRDYETVRGLAEAPVRAAGGLGWRLSRIATYLQRSRARRQVVAAGGFDLCHIHSLNRFTDWQGLRRLAKSAPLVSTVHDVLPHAPRFPGALERRLLARTYRYGGSLIVAHDWMGRQLQREFGVAPDRIETVPIPIPRVDPAPDPADRDEPPCVLFFGTLRANKGIPVLLDAVSRLPAALELEVRFAGQGEPRLAGKIVEAARADPRIRCEIGWVSPERRDELYRRAALVVLPYTRFASQSGVLGDAYAYRVPVVASDVGALGLAVREDGTGWVVPPGNPDALAAAIVEALGDVAARRDAAAAAGRLAASRSFEAVGARLRRIYDRVAGGRIGAQ